MRRNLSLLLTLEGAWESEAGISADDVSDVMMGGDTFSKTWITFTRAVVTVILAKQAAFSATGPVRLFVLFVCNTTGRRN